MAELHQEEACQELEETASQESQDYEPLGRRGACSFVYNGCFYLYGGALTGAQPFNQLPSVGVELLDLLSGQWSSVDTKVLRSLPSSVSGSCCTVVHDNLYVFGGWLAGGRNADIHELNLKTLEWRKLLGRNPRNGPLCKDKAGMFGYGEHMVGVLGGYGYSDTVSEAFLESKPASYHWDPTSRSFLFGGLYWTNELHLFHVDKLEWIVPVTTGAPPPPCAAFSLTRVDPYRLVLFGGKQLSQRVNDVHILDLDTWHWSGVNVPSRPDEPWPIGRSFHAACSLVDPSTVPSPHAPSSGVHEWLPCPAPDLLPSEPSLNVEPKLLVLYGMDNNADPINDVWELNVNTLAWNRVRLPGGAAKARAWHTAAAYHPFPSEAVVVVCGGVSENLFNTPETSLKDVRTTVLYCGVRCLSELCMEAVIHDAKLLGQSDQLPWHIQKQLQEHKAIRKQFKLTGYRL